LRYDLVGDSRKAVIDRDREASRTLHANEILAGITNLLDHDRRRKRETDGFSATI
jgi:hypothetical protein